MQFILFFCIFKRNHKHQERNHPKHSTYSSVASYLKHQQIGV